MRPTLLSDSAEEIAKKKFAKKEIAAEALAVEAIRIGALVDGNGDCLAAGRRLAALGYESLQLSYWAQVADPDLTATAARLAAAIGDRDCVCSTLGVYGNPLADNEAGTGTLRSIRSLVEAAPAFGVPVVSCFAGRVPGRSVEDSIPTLQSRFGPIIDRAAALGITLAFENCRFADTWNTGKWNIALGPEAWQLIFDAFSGANLALEWEPAHQILALADPLAQLSEWAPRIAHVHAKDAVVNRDSLALNGMHGRARLGSEVLAGYGDTDWEAVFRILAAAGYRGTIDIEIGSIAEWQGPRETEGLDLARAALIASRIRAAEAAAAKDATPAPAGNSARAGGGAQRP